MGEPSRGGIGGARRRVRTVRAHPGTSSSITDCARAKWATVYHLGGQVVFCRDTGFVLKPCTGPSAQNNQFHYCSCVENLVSLEGVSN